jgi:hypothetical protein
MKPLSLMAFGSYSLSLLAPSSYPLVPLCNFEAEALSSQQLYVRDQITNMFRPCRYLLPF